MLKRTSKKRARKEQERKQRAKGFSKRLKIQRTRERKLKETVLGIDPEVG